MKIESVKSFILVVLIGISLLLSLTLWSYQPNSDRTIGGEVVNNEIDDVGGSSDKSKNSLIKPTDIIFHTSDRYYGFVQAEAKGALYEQMQEWVITNFEPDAGERSFATSQNGVELTFADAIPMEVINTLFNFGQEENNYPSWSMNRIFISFIPESKSLNLEFISDEDNNTARAVINATEPYEDLSSIINTLDDGKLQRYLAINEDTSAIYIPEEPVSLPIHSITPTEINPSLFVNILFANPSVVRETTSASIGEAYFTDNRQMNVYQDRMRMEYVNHVEPSIEDKMLITEVDLLDQSIKSINSHSGWTEEYRLEDIDLENGRVSFQMYYEGYPVFSNKLSTIQQRWTMQQSNMQLQLIEYDRPLYILGSKFKLREADDLASGENVITYLENNTDVVLENIEDIKVGYELKYQRDDPESEYIELDPAWYKKENNMWQRIVFDELSNPKGVE